MKNSPLIIALDVESAAEARALVASIGDAASFYKVGLELYASAGMDFVRELKGAGQRVFLDLKSRIRPRRSIRLLAAESEVVPAEKAPGLLRI